jgi:hypothetical protein
MPEELLKSLKFLSFGDFSKYADEPNKVLQETVHQSAQSFILPTLNPNRVLIGVANTQLRQQIYISNCCKAKTDAIEVLPGITQHICSKCGHVVHGIVSVSFVNQKL